MNHPSSFNIARYPINAFGEVIEMAKNIEQSLEQRGLQTVKTSRIGQYRKILEEFVGAVDKQKQQKSFSLPHFHQALFEISQISNIVEQLLKPPVSSDWLPQVQKLVSGHLFPQTELENSVARDIQVELLIAASCRQGGFEVEPKEPDILVRDYAGDFGIAVKRPKSTKTLEKHIRKGSDQIEKSGIDGILALDLNLIQNPNNEIHEIESRDILGASVRRFVDGFIEHDSPRIRSMVKIPDVFGLLVCSSSLFYIRNELRFAVASRQAFRNLCDHSSPRCSQLRRFAMQFGANAK